MELTEFWTIASSNGIVLDKKQIEMFERYATELVYWNSKINLISRKDEENVYERHILHSISALKYINIPKKSRCLDVGSGGGLPGIPIAMASNDIFMLMVDSIGKKVKITDMLAKHTGLRNISAMNTRAEKLAENPKYLSAYDFIFARAVTRIADILDWCDRLLKPDGKFVLYKGGDMTEEIRIAGEKFPHYRFETINIDLFGCQYFTSEDKKIVVVERK